MSIYNVRPLKGEAAFSLRPGVLLGPRGLWKQPRCVCTGGRALGARGPEAPSEGPSAARPLPGRGPPPPPPREPQPRSRGPV